MTTVSTKFVEFVEGTIVSAITDLCKLLQCNRPSTPEYDLIRHSIPLLLVVLYNIYVVTISVYMIQVYVRPNYVSPSLKWQCWIIVTPTSVPVWTTY